MKIFVTRKIPQPGLDLLKKQHTVEVNPHDRVLSKTEILKGVQGKDGLLCLLTDPIDAEVIATEPKLKMIASYAVGYDNIDIAAATKRKIPVSNTPDVLTETTAELAWALLFAVSRRIVEGDAYTRDGKFTGWAPMLLLGQDISHKTLGVIGTGRIGTAFALKSKGFDMKILYADKQKNQTLEDELKATHVPLETLLKESDFISLHVPLTKETQYLIDEKQLKLMKKTAVLINTSRGPIIRETALVKALRQHWIFGAGLDVYEKEPQLAEELKTLPNVILLPHLGSATLETRTKMAVMAAENIIAGLNGDVPPNCVNTEVFKKKPIM
jgi:glyoxylate reductase